MSEEEIIDLEYMLKKPKTNKRKKKEIRFEINSNYYNAIENLIKEYKELKNQLNDIHSNFCKFNWKESNNIQVYNQLKELYESIYRKDK